MRTLQEWMGHRDLQTTQRYADYAPSQHESQLVERARASTDGHAPAATLPRYRDDPSVPGLRVGYPLADVRYCEHMAVADRIDTGTETLTIVYEDADDGWVAARIQEVPAAISQGRTREAARANVISALHDLTQDPRWDERMLYRVRSMLDHSWDERVHRVRSMLARR
jgi:hypothetical protein